MEKIELVGRNDLLKILGFSNEYLKLLEMSGQNTDSQIALQNDCIDMESLEIDSISTNLELIVPTQNDSVTLFITNTVEE